MSIPLAGPHQGQQVLITGTPLAEAEAAMIMVHGRGDNAENFLGLTAVIDRLGFAFLAPQAANNTWYPYSFLAPLSQNEPGISSGIQRLADLVEEIAASGVAPEKVMLVGFSQGACLALEFAARNARRFGALVGLSGGLIGPDGTPRNYEGSLSGTPVFLGCSDVDFHIPKERVVQTAEVLRNLGGDVTMKLYAGMGHLINEEELQAIKHLMARLVPDPIP